MVVGSGDLKTTIVHVDESSYSPDNLNLFKESTINGSSNYQNATAKF